MKHHVPIFFEIQWNHNFGTTFDGTMTFLEPLLPEPVVFARTKIKHQNQEINKKTGESQSQLINLTICRNTECKC